MVLLCDQSVAQLNPILALGTLAHSGTHLIVSCASDCGSIIQNCERPESGIEDQRREQADDKRYTSEDGIEIEL